MTHCWLWGRPDFELLQVWRFRNTANSRILEIENSEKRIKLVHWVYYLMMKHQPVQKIHIKARKCSPLISTLHFTLSFGAGWDDRY
jgi:hypothetical protein